MRFSQRIGVTDVRSALQGRSLDQPTRSRLWSAFVQRVPVHKDRRIELESTWMHHLYSEIWMDLFKVPVDDIPDQLSLRKELKKEFIQGQWHEVYDLLEFVMNSKNFNNRKGFTEDIERILAEEHAGFRLIAGQFVEITDKSEIAAIEEGLSSTQGDRFTPAREHLSAALGLLSDRQAPNYRNSVKESISAVEAIIQILTGDPRAELGKGLKLLRTDPPIHGALRSALVSLYGYTSDAEGIRHALTEEPNLDAADAKFMIVVCSAFVVYLIQRSAGLRKESS